MTIVSGLYVPGSKYDTTLPYTYMAKEFIIEGEEDITNHYFADTICGLIDYLDENFLTPDRVEIFGVYRNSEIMLDKKYCTDGNGKWLKRPEICHSLEEHYKQTMEIQYKGHLEHHDCSFTDRERDGIGPF